MKEREHFWIKKLKTLTPYDLNQELNWYHVMQYPQCSLYFLLSAYGRKIWRTKANWRQITQYHVVNHIQNYAPWKRKRPKLVGNCCIVFTSVFPIIHCATYYIYIFIYTIYILLFYRIDESCLWTNAIWIKVGKK